MTKRVHRIGTLLGLAYLSFESSPKEELACFLSNRLTHRSRSFLSIASKLQVDRWIYTFLTSLPNFDLLWASTTFAWADQDTASTSSFERFGHAQLWRKLASCLYHKWHSLIEILICHFQTWVCFLCTLSTFRERISNVWQSCRRFVFHSHPQWYFQLKFIHLSPSSMKTKQKLVWNIDKSIFHDRNLLVSLLAGFRK